MYAHICILTLDHEHWRDSTVVTCCIWPMDEKRQRSLSWPKVTFYLFLLKYKRGVSEFISLFLEQSHNDEFHEKGRPFLFRDSFCAISRNRDGSQEAALNQQAPNRLACPTVRGSPTTDPLAFEPQHRFGQCDWEHRPKRCDRARSMAAFCCQV